MIFISTNILNAYDRKLISTDTHDTLINFLTAYYPDGFDTPVDISVNTEVIPVNEYDMTLKKGDIIILLDRTALPVGLIGGWLITALANMVISTVAGWALQRLFAPELPEGNTGSSASTSSVYSLNSNQNRTRIGEAIPVIYGTVKLYPTMINQPYYRYENNEQYLYHLLCIGQGKYTQGDLFIGDQDVTIDADVTYKKLEQNTFYDIPLNVPDSNYCEAVDTLVNPSNLELKTKNGGRLEWEFVAPNTIVLHSTGNAGVVVGSRLCFSNAPSNLKIFDVLSVTNQGDHQDITVSQSVSNEASLLRYFGFYQETDKYDLHTDAKIAEVDYIYSTGLLNIGDDGDSQHLGDTFNIYIWNKDTGSLLNTVVQHTVSNSIEVVRKTAKFSVQYGVDIQISLGKVTASSTGSRAQNKLTIERVKGLMPSIDNTAYGDITLLWVKVRASNAISASGQFLINGYFTRSDIPNDIKSVLTDIYTNTAYGGRLPSHDLVFPNTAETVNCAFDKNITLFDAMRSISKSQKYSLYLAGQEVLLKYDDINDVYSALYNETNIIRNSLKVQYLFKEVSKDTDSIECTYINDKWEQDTAIYPTGGVYPMKSDLFGVAGAGAEAIAQSMAMYIYKQDEFRSSVISFNTDIQGLVPQFLDKILISHNALQWGNTAGEILSISGDILELSDPIIDINDVDTIVFRNIDGSVSDPVNVVAIDENRVRVSTLPLWVEPRFFYTIQGKHTLAREYLVTNIKPSSDGVTIECVNYSEEIYI